MRWSGPCVGPHQATASHNWGLKCARAAKERPKKAQIAAGFGRKNFDFCRVMCMHMWCSLVGTASLCGLVCNVWVPVRGKMMWVTQAAGRQHHQPYPTFGCVRHPGTGGPRNREQGGAGLSPCGFVLHRAQLLSAELQRGRVAGTGQQVQPGPSLGLPGGPP